MDTDTTVRKLLYNVLGKLTARGDDCPKAFGPTHPRILSITQRELIIRNGLGDRNPQVEAAAASLLTTWVNCVDVKVEEKDVKVEEQVPEKLGSGVLSLLTLLDLGEGTIAEDALLSIFKTEVDTFKFDGKNSHFLCGSLFFNFFRFHRGLLVYLEPRKSLSGKSVCRTLQKYQRLRKARKCSSGRDLNRIPYPRGLQPPYREYHKSGWSC